MPQIPDLPYLAAQMHSQPSIAAAEAALPNAGTLRRRVYDQLRQWHATGGTDEDLQIGLGMDPSTQRPRRIELVNAGLVRDSGRTRKTRSGRRATVWVAV
jgi:hypothetical protein